MGVTRAINREQEETAIARRERYSQVNLPPKTLRGYSRSEHRSVIYFSFLYPCLQWKIYCHVAFPYLGFPHKNVCIMYFVVFCFVFFLSIFLIDLRFISNRTKVCRHYLFSLNVFARARNQQRFGFGLTSLALSKLNWLSLNQFGSFRT